MVIFKFNFYNKSHLINKLKNFIFSDKEQNKWDHRWNTASCDKYTDRQ